MPIKSQEGVMSDDRDNPSKSPASKIAAQASENTQRGTQTMKEMGRAAQDTGRQTMQEMGKAAQDMGRRTTEAGLAGMAEFSRMFGDMKFPGVPDMDAFLAAHRRNMETLSAANRVALEGAQTVAKRHMEIVQQTMQEMSETIRELASPDSPQARAAKQAELIKHAYERAVSNIKELADLIQRSNGEALNMLNMRFAEAMDEVKAMAEKANKKSV
jgi:phasin family protein